MRREFANPEAGPVLLDLELSVGTIEVISEQRQHAGIALEPVKPDDEVAAESIRTADVRSQGGKLRAKVPQDSTRQPTMVTNSGNVIVTGTGSCVQAAGDITIRNGRIISGTTVVGADSGAVRITARLPLGSTIRADSQAADMTVSGQSIDEVSFRSVSGDLSIDAADRVDASTTSGDVCVHDVASLQTKTVSGDVRASTTGAAAVNTVSGDVVLRALANCEVSARTVSGDIGVSASPGVRARCGTTTVSGHVRTPEIAGAA